MILFLILAAFVAFIYYIGIQPMYYWKKKGVKQGKKMWLFGDNFRVLFGLDCFAENLLKVYNEVPGTRYAAMYQFGTPILLIKDSELIKHISVKDFDHFVNRRVFVPASADPLWGKNLFSLKDSKWREMRPLLSPSFTGSKMRLMFDLMSDCAQDFAEYFLKMNQDSVDVEMKDMLTRYTNDVIATTAFGIKTDSLADRNNEFYLTGYRISDLRSFSRKMRFFGYVFLPKLFSALKVRIFEKDIADYFTNLIENTIKTRQEKGIIRQDMIQLLMEAQKGIRHSAENKEVINEGFATVEDYSLKQAEKIAPMELNLDDIVAQATVFFFFFFDTVAANMCFMIYELAVNPDIQTRLRNEIKETLKDCKGKINYDTLAKMKYLDMVVSESLRKWPAGLAIDRVCTKPYTIEPVSDDEIPIHIEIGDIVMFPILGLHRDPAFFPDPERFDPERFNDDNKGNIDPYLFIPFGSGPRNCIGNRFALLEMKVVVFHLLNSFEIVPNEKTMIPLKLCKKHFTLHAEGGFQLSLKRLSK